MKIKKIFMSCLLLAGVLSASAQEEYPKTVYDHNPYWFIQLQGGAQYTLGEIDFKDLISPNVQIAIGRQFTPVFSMRLQANAWQSKAGIDAGTRPSWKWKYVAPGLDLTFNLSNLFCGFNPNRVFNFSVFIGGGANIGWDNKADEINSIYKSQYQSAYNAGLISENIDYIWDGTKIRAFGRAGIAADFRLSNAVSLGLEVNANTLSDRYNSKKAGNWDWYFNALAGLKINLGKTYTTRTIEAPKVPEKVIEKVIERVVEKPCPQPAVVEPTHAVAQKKEDKFRRDVFFTIGRTNISKAEQAKVKEVADYMKANPNSTVEVTGYADRGTGNPTINRRLSQGRAEGVANMLQRTYGIAKNRIKVDFKGDTIQPFAKDIENRVSICIAE
jgi:outer membrane protein OmpA-like peptidoglycan-associated protein